MKLSGHTVLVTGGSSGIGRALAASFVQRGNEVVVTGRRREPLEAFKAEFPTAHIKISDASIATDRIDLADWVTREFPRLDVVVNNAGTQRKVKLTGPEPWDDTANEIDLNLGAPIHLSMLLAPHLVTQPEAHILNVSSGLAFVPIALMPVYCATKAALHSFTLSLREQLKSTSVKVVEIIPPAVKTNLGGSHDFGEELDVYIQSVLEQLEAGALETTFGLSTFASRMSREEADATFKRMNSPQV